MVSKVKAIIYFRLGDADAGSYKYEPMAVLLARWEIIKKYNHGNHYGQQKYVLPFVLSVEVILGREALVVLSQLIIFIAKKKEEPILQVRV